MLQSEKFVDIPLHDYNPTITAKASKIFGIPTGDSRKEPKKVATMFGVPIEDLEKIALEGNKRKQASRSKKYRFFSPKKFGRRISETGSDVLKKMGQLGRRISNPFKRHVGAAGSAGTSLVPPPQHAPEPFTGESQYHIHGSATPSPSFDYSDVELYNPQKVPTETSAEQIAEQRFPLQEPSHSFTIHSAYINLLAKELAQGKILLNEEIVTEMMDRVINPSQNLSHQEKQWLRKLADELLNMIPKPAVGRGKRKHKKHTSSKRRRTSSNRRRHKKRKKRKKMRKTTKSRCNKKNSTINQ